MMPAPARIRRVAHTRIPTKWGVFETFGFKRARLNGNRVTDTALALLLGSRVTDAPLLRIHSQCLTGESFGSLRCDCSEQLAQAMQIIAEEGSGLVIYEFQEGRGIGLMAKLRAYALQDEGLDTVDANHALGFAADSRDFTLPAAILQHFDITRVRLLSNNPRKTLALSRAGIEVLARVPCEAKATSHSLAYLRAKQEKLGHTLTLDSVAGEAIAGLPHR